MKKSQKISLVLISVALASCGRQEDDWDAYSNSTSDSARHHHAYYGGYRWYGSPFYDRPYYRGPFVYAPHEYYAHGYAAEGPVFRGGFGHTHGSSRGGFGGGHGGGAHG